MISGYEAAQRNYDRQEPHEYVVDLDDVYTAAKKDRLEYISKDVLQFDRDASNLIGYMCDIFDETNKKSAWMRLVRALASKDDAQILASVKEIYAAACEQDAEYTALRAVDEAETT